MLLPMFGFMFVAFPAMLLTAIGAFVPILRILRRMGFQKWHIVLYYLPFVNVIFIWRLASSPWPTAGRLGYSEVFK